MSHSTPIGQIQFEEADPHTPVNSQRRLVTPPPVSSKVQRSGLVHIIGKDPPKILKADINDDGVVDTLDILAYFNAWNEER